MGMASHTLDALGEVGGFDKSQFNYHQVTSGAFSMVRGRAFERLQMRTGLGILWLKLYSQTPDHRPAAADTCLLGIAWCLLD